MYFDNNIRCRSAGDLADLDKVVKWDIKYIMISEGSGQNTWQEV